MSVTPNAQSWIESANGHPDFPLQNLPLGVFSPPGDSPRGGVAIGDYIFDLKTACETGLFHGAAHQAALVASGDSLNAFFALGGTARRTLRDALIHLLSEGCGEQKRMEHLGAALLKPQAACRMHLPAKVGDYTDFYVGIHHAQNVGKLFRPDNPLLPNYKYVPIGYHGRASTVVPSGTEVRRPNGQTLPAGAEAPVFGPCARMDLELELGIWIGQGNDQGKAIPINAASGHIAGFCLLNDWSARDVQAWEYQPLGPFLSKKFRHHGVALGGHRRGAGTFPRRPTGPPGRRSATAALPLRRGRPGNTARWISNWKSCCTPRACAREHQGPERIALSNTLNMYWTVAQMVAHHSVNGCRPASRATCSVPAPSPEKRRTASAACWSSPSAASRCWSLGNGEERRFLEDGDEIIFRARCRREGYASIGFGECRGRILPAH
ncbi:MAG: fumarylacetoacetate hydrolase family protein [Pseudomonas sp.]